MTTKSISLQKATLLILLVIILLGISMVTYNVYFVKLVNTSEELSIYQDVKCEKYRSVEYCYCLYEGNTSKNIYHEYTKFCGYHIHNNKVENFTYSKKLFSSELRIVQFY